MYGDTDSPLRSECVGVHRSGHKRAMMNRGREREREGEGEGEREREREGGRERGREGREGNNYQFLSLSGTSRTSGGDLVLFLSR